MFDLSQARHICRGAPGDSLGALEYVPEVPARVGKFPKTVQGLLYWARELPDTAALLDTDPGIWREHGEIVPGGGLPTHDMDILFDSGSTTW